MKLELKSSAISIICAGAYNAKNTNMKRQKQHHGIVFEF